MEAQVAILGSEIIIAGGATTGTEYQDVWGSLDIGATWIELVAAAPWRFRTNFRWTVLGAVARGNKYVKPEIWLQSGSDDNDDVVDDVWTSYNGRDWIQRTAATGLVPPGRKLHGTVVLGGSVFLWGGMDEANEFSENVYSAMTIDKVLRELEGGSDQLMQLDSDEVCDNVCEAKGDRGGRTGVSSGAQMGSGYARKTWECTCANAGEHVVTCRAESMSSDIEACCEYDRCCMHTAMIDSAVTNIHLF
jgi:hypothetical protein